MHTYRHTHFSHLDLANSVDSLSPIRVNQAPSDLLVETRAIQIDSFHT